VNAYSGFNHYKKSRSSVWLEHYTDNVGVSSSNLLETTTHKGNDSFGELAQLARAPALHAGGQRFESVILHAVFYSYSTTV
jgi:hypothetical protein